MPATQLVFLHGFGEDERVWADFLPFHTWSYTAICPAYAEWTDCATLADYARKIVLKDKSSKDALVKEIMVSEVICIKPSDNLDYCMELMNTKKIRHLPVMDNNVVVGIISISDVVKAIIEIQKDTINHLNSYITQ